MGNYKGHRLLLYLDKNLSMHHVDLQSRKHLGRSYAGLLAYITGLYHLGELSKPEFLRYQRKYTQPLDKDMQQITLEEVAEQKHLSDLNKRFGQVVEQWSLHPEQEWREGWVHRASEHGDLPNAKLLLAKASESHQNEESQ